MHHKIKFKLTVKLRIIVILQSGENPDHQA